MEEKKLPPASRQLRFFRAHSVSCVVSEILLFFANLYDCHRNYYLATNCVVCATAVIFATTTNSIVRFWMFLGIAIIYNPFVPIKALNWGFVNFLTMGLMVATLIIETNENIQEENYREWRARES